MEKINFIFFGTPDIASKTLDILKECNYIPSLIVTSIDKPKGRKMLQSPSPVKTWAIENRIPYLQPDKLDDEFIDKLKSLDYKLSIVVAYGKIIPKRLINLKEFGTINIHYSLLPKYRGASPVETCLLNGDTETGISIQQMAFELDSGDIIAQEKINIDINDTKIELMEKLIKIGGKLLCKTIPNIINKCLNLTIQDESNKTFCSKIKKEDGEINPDINDKENWNKYRAFCGWPGVFFFKNKNRVKITKAQYENNSFVIKRVIRENKKEINYSDFLKQN